MSEWESFNLNPTLLDNIKELYTEPTEIQQKVLVYTSAKVDLLIQARTGEGKTLCYGIPIINYLLNCYSRIEENEVVVDKTKLSPAALILVPTRELGIQVKNHLEKVLLNTETNKNHCNIKIANVLGGFAKPKQIKILNKLNPEIIIATPGRLWEIIENEESPLLEKLNSLKFLVIDEADRMTEMGHFTELKNIIDHVYNRIELKKKKSDEGDNGDKGKTKIKTIQSDITMEEDVKENEKLAKKLKVDVNKIETIDPLELLDNEADFDEELDIGKGEEDNEEEKKEDDDEMEINEDIDEDNQYNEEEDDDDEDKEEEDEEDNKKNLIDFRNIQKEKRKEISDIELNPYISMRTFLCSATIDQVHQESQSKKSNKKHKEKKSTLTTEEQHFQKLIRNLKFYNKLIYLKLKNQRSNLITSIESNQPQSQSNSKTGNAENSTITQILPEKLEVDCYKCDPSTKDYYLFHILKENIKKRIIIFTNSISHTKKLYSIFSYFNEFQCTVLHSKMLQNSRIKNLDRFSSNQLNILFCTDIGARGLDIPYVDLVIHYHIPQRTETFIHRSGRTARANRSGKVTSLITQKELMLYKKIMIDLHYTQFAMKTLSIVQLEKIKSLFEFAKQIERETFQIKKVNREKQWYKKSAEQCEMLMDDEDNREEENEDKEAKEQEKMLTKKRNMISKEKLNHKKIYTKINEKSIKRTSYLTPELVSKWNEVIKESNFKNENLTQALYQAQNDARSIRFKEKPKKKRYQRRRNKK